MAVPEARFRGNPWPVIAVLCLGLFMTLLDLTIVNVAIPRIVDGVQASLDQVLWVLNGYSLAYAVLLITSGRTGDILGPRNVFTAGLALFTAASAFSGFAQDPAQLIAGRALQGVGAALIAPQTLPLVMSILPADRRGGAFALTGIMAGLAVVAGPTLGGFLVTHFGWRWIFFVNLPVGVLAVLLTLLLVPDLRPGRRHRLDLVGVLLATTGLFGVVFGLIEGQRYDWGTITGSLTIPEVIGAGILLLGFFAVFQALRQDREPLLPFAVFRDRNFALVAGVATAMGFCVLALFLPLTIFYQSVLGLSAQDAGLTIAPQALAMMFVSPVAGPLAQRLGGRYILMLGLAMLAAGISYIAWMAQADAARWSLLPGLIVNGVGMGCIWSPMYSIAMRDLKPHLAGAASGVLNTVQELGGVIATASVGALLQNRLATALHEQALQDAGRLPAELRERFVSGFGSARSGLEIGAGQSGVPLPSGLPTQVALQLQQVAHQVFTHAFVAAMRPTLVAPVVVLVLAALSCLAMRRRAGAPGQFIAEEAA
ncbi:MAG: DHA2 family efflux MFS transporter permease subunit [Candidatus Dormibacteraeota bacterium]|nr:DHA2 family efflux MFS transporter permease subunit [Candidatus Dormibacteraeota bacterium]